MKSKGTIRSLLYDPVGRPCGQKRKRKNAERQREREWWAEESKGRATRGYPIFGDLVHTDDGVGFVFVNKRDYDGEKKSGGSSGSRGVNGG
jgi:hypothetical protein